MKDHTQGAAAGTVRAKLRPPQGLCSKLCTYVWRELDFLLETYPRPSRTTQRGRCIMKKPTGSNTQHGALGIWGGVE